MRSTLASLSAITSVVLVAGCASGQSGADDGKSASDGSVATGVGVTDDTISVGVLTDLTGPFSAVARTIHQGEELYWEEQNSHGGVCGRAVELVLSDHAYSVQQAVSQYSALRNKVVALEHFLGSPMVNAVQSKLEQDHMFTVALANSSQFLDSPTIALPGTTYAHEAASGISWAFEQGMLSEGDTLGMVYLEGDLGEDSVRGGKAAAEHYDLNLETRKVTPADTDLTGQVRSLAEAGADFIFLITTPPQTASAVSVGAASGSDLAFMGLNMSFVPSLLEGPAGEALQSNFFVTSLWTPFSSDDAGVSHVRELYEEAHPGEVPPIGPMEGWATATIMHRVLEAACEAGDLTREGLVAVFDGLSELDTNGVIPPGVLDYSDKAEPPTTSIHIVQPDKAEFGWTRIVAESFSGDWAVEL